MFKMLFCMLRKEARVLTEDEWSRVDEALFARDHSHGSDEADAGSEPSSFHQALESARSTAVGLMNHISTKRLSLSLALGTAHVLLLGVIVGRFDDWALLRVAMLSGLGLYLCPPALSLIMSHINLSASSVLVTERIETKLRVRPVSGISKAYEILHGNGYYSQRLVEIWIAMTLPAFYVGAILLKYFQG